MGRIFMILFFAISVSPIINALPTTEELLACVDSLILNQNEFERRQRFVADEYRCKLHAARNDEERYRVNNLLYELYSRQSIDSAMNYVDANMHILAKLSERDTDRETDMIIKKSFLYAASGLLLESSQLISGLESGKMPAWLRRAYFAQMAYLNDHLANYSRIIPVGENPYFDSSNSYKDSLVNMLSKDDKEWPWYYSWANLGAESKVRRRIISELKEIVNNSTLSTQDDAKNAYAVGMLYSKEGDMENALRYTLLSAIADISTCNRDIASLQRLAIMCLDRGDIEHAHNYIGYCMETSLKYPNRVRASTIAPLQHKINAAYQERLRNKDRMQKVLLWIVSALALCLTVLIVALAREIVRGRAERRNVEITNSLLNDRVEELEETKMELSELNERLSKLNDQFKTANEELKEANYVKEEYVGQVFSLCSHYIKKLDDFRRSIYRKAKMNQTQDILVMTEGKDMEKEALKEFYISFDTIFLHLYPNFVRELNTLMQPGYEILPKDEELLTTELRIYALIRLGITDSVKIAELLHCSPQTVYNYRFRTRNHASLPKAEFIDAVKNLGHAVVE